MIANILATANSSSIAINDRFPSFAHPMSIAFSKSPLSRDELRNKLGKDLVPGIVTGLGFESMVPFDLASADWVNLRENSSDIVATFGSEVVGQVNQRPLYGGKATTTALVADPADIRAAVANGVVATIPVWEVEYVSSLVKNMAPNVTESRPPVKLGVVPGRLPRNHSFKLYPSPGGPVYVEYTMTKTKRAAAAVATYHPFSAL